MVIWEHLIEVDLGGLEFGGLEFGDFFGFVSKRAALRAEGLRSRASRGRDLGVRASRGVSPNRG